LKQVSRRWYNWNKSSSCRARSPNEPGTDMAPKEVNRRKRIHLESIHYNSSENIYFLAMCTDKKQPYFSNPILSKVIADELEHRHRNREMKLFCYCIMPDHLHLLVSLEEDYLKEKGAFGERTLQDWVSAFKRYTSRVGSTHNIKPLWQSNFYDHIVRNDESLTGICEYILNNPVRRGIVSTSEEYPYARKVDNLPV
jgi:putative transposase